MSYFRYPSSGGIQTYPTFAAFPATAADGTIALALDTDILYAFNTGSSSWVVIGGPGSVLSIGTLDSETPSADGAVINVTNELVMQSASATVPGLINTGIQTLAGAKTFSAALTASSGLSITTGGLTVTAGAVTLTPLTAGTLLALDGSKQIVSQGLGNLVGDVSSNISVTGGSSAVVGGGTSIAQLVATGAQNGYLSSADWTTFNNKQSALTFGNLTEATSSVLTILGGTGAVIGSGASIQVSQATTSTSGYLSSTDWNTFNGKIDGAGAVTDNAIVRFDGTGGKTVQNSVVTIADTTGLMTFNPGAGASTALDQIIFNNALDQNPHIKCKQTTNQLGLRISSNNGAKTWNFQDNGALVGDIFQTPGIMQFKDMQIGTAVYQHWVSFGTGSNFAVKVDNQNSSALSNSTLWVVASTAASIGQKIQGKAAQTSDLLNINNSADSVLFLVGANGQFTANEQGAAVNCRIEGATDADLFVTDGTNDRVGIGTSSPSTKLHVVGGARITGLSAVGVVLNDATGVLSTLAPGTSGNVLTSNGSAWVSSAPSTTVDSSVNGFRLTLTTGVPVTTSDVTGATTIYCTPFKSNRIALYNGSSWDIVTSSEFSLALGTLTSGKPYDVFCYNNAGTATLEFLVWTNDTTRATALTQQDGVYVKSGATTRRYMGTFYTTSTTTTEDSATKRYLFNVSNRVRKPLYVTDTGNWNYTTPTVRQANANANNQVEVINGLEIDPITLKIMVMVSCSTSADIGFGIGLDSTTTFVSGQMGGGGNINNETTEFPAFYDGYVGIGRHYLAWLEAGNSGGTLNWIGQISVSGGMTSYHGLTGNWIC